MLLWHVYGFICFRKKIGAWHVGILMNELILFLIIEYLLMVSNAVQCKCNKGIGYCFMPVGAHCCCQLLVNASELYLDAILYKLD